MTTHFSFIFLCKVSDWSGANTNKTRAVVPLWVLFCRRKLDNSSIAKVIIQVFSGLVTVWFLILFVFQVCFTFFLPEALQNVMGHGQGAEQMRESLSLVRVIGFAHRWEKLLKRLSLLKAQRTVCVVLWWELSQEDIKVSVYCLTAKTLSFGKEHYVLTGEFSWKNNSK